MLRSGNYSSVRFGVMVVMSALVVQLPWTPAFGQGGTSSPCLQRDAGVVVRDARLSVHAADQSLAMLLGAIARCVPSLAIRVAPQLEDDLVSIGFAGVAVDDGLRQILQAYDAFFYYGGASHPTVLQRVWVFPRGSGDALAPLDAAVWASDADVDRRLTEADPDIRVRAVKALIERRGDAAISAVLNALADPDDAVRAQVLDLALGNGLQIPPELPTLASAAQNDPDPYVQMEARSILARLAVAPSGDGRQ
jgi:hypothetical protein